MGYDLLAFIVGGAFSLFIIAAIAYGIIIKPALCRELD